MTSPTHKRKKVIEKQLSTDRIIITDEERVKWRNGVEEYWNTPKSDRPEFNVYEYEFDDEVSQAYYKLREMAHSYPINKTPVEIQEAMEQMEKLEKIYHAYLRHVLAVCLSPQSPHPKRV